VIAENCNLCKLCIILTGCMAISLGKTSLDEDTIFIDPEQCYGCGLCVDACNRDAIEMVEVVDEPSG
jgi:TPP-dependent indolepyruvate ferredoxin oxidoreductase alpha subunit